MAEDNAKYQDRLKYWKIARGARKLKNRSSKSILTIVHYNGNKIWKSMSNEFLNELSKNGSFDATQEINRRNRKKNRKIDK